jgi:hypothetical protein
MKMKTGLPFVIAASFLLIRAAPVHGLTVEVGAIAGGGLALMYGSFLDSRAADLAQMGAASPGTLGSSQTTLFPGWTLGAYAQTDVLAWLSLRLEAYFESAGAERIALTSGGAPFDQYGVSFASVNIPFRAIAHTALGPGQLFGGIGPFLGILAGSISIVDRYLSSTTTAAISPDISHVFFFGVSGGIGYSMLLGPGRAGLELRTDWSILPVTAGAALPGGNLNPIGVQLVASYGMQIGDHGR